MAFPSRAQIPLTGIFASQFNQFVPLQIAVPFPSQYGQTQIPLSGTQPTSTPTVTIGGSVTSIAPSSAAAIAPASGGSSFPTWAIAVIASVCGVLVAIAAGALLFFLCRRRGRYGGWSSEPLFATGKQSRLSRLAHQYFSDDKPSSTATPIEEKQPEPKTISHASFLGLGAVRNDEPPASTRRSVGSGSVSGSRPPSRSSRRSRQASGDNDLTAENLFALEKSNVIIPSSRGSSAAGSPRRHRSMSPPRSPSRGDMHRPSLQRLVEDESDDGYISQPPRKRESTMISQQLRAQSRQSMRSDASFRTAQSDELDFEEQPRRSRRTSRPRSSASRFTGYE